MSLAIMYFIDGYIKVCIQWSKRCLKNSKLNFDDLIRSYGCCYEGVAFMIFAI